MKTGEVSAPVHREESPGPVTGPVRGVTASLAAELLEAVESGSTPALLEVLSRIALIDATPLEGPPIDGVLASSPERDEERERLELLRALAVQLRLDLHAMLMHIYQRIEASRGYLEVVRHLAGREADGRAGLWNPIARVTGPEARAEEGSEGQEVGSGERSGEN